mgnify:CR=1 FL=1
MFNNPDLDEFINQMRQIQTFEQLEMYLENWTIYQIDTGILDNFMRIEMGAEPDIYKGNLAFKSTQGQYGMGVKPGDYISLDLVKDNLIKMVIAGALTKKSGE